MIIQFLSPLFSPKCLFHCFKVVLPNAESQSNGSNVETREASKISVMPSQDKSICMISSFNTLVLWRFLFLDGITSQNELTSPQILSLPCIASSINIAHPPCSLFFNPGKCRNLLIPLYMDQISPPL